MLCVSSSAKVHGNLRVSGVYLNTHVSMRKTSVPETFLNLIRNVKIPKFQFQNFDTQLY